LQDVEGVTGRLSLGPDHVLRRPAFVIRLEGGRTTRLKTYPPGE
jgi:hypothetical protein